MLDNLFDSINVYIADNAGAWWVLLVVFALCFIDGIIPPLPSDAVVVALAAVGASSVGEPNLAALFAAAAVGAFAGDQTAYTIGRHSPLAKLASSRNERMRKMMAWADRQLTRRGAMIIVAARYIPIGRIAVNFTAGAIKYPRSKFLRFDAVGAITWAGYSVGIGALAGQWMENNPLLGATIAICLAVVLGYLIDRLMQRRSNAAESGSGHTEPNPAEQTSASLAPEAPAVDAAEAIDVTTVEGAVEGADAGNVQTLDGTNNQGQGL